MWVSGCYHLVGNVSPDFCLSYINDALRLRLVKNVFQLLSRANARVFQYSCCMVGHIKQEVFIYGIFGIPLDMRVVPRISVGNKFFSDPVHNIYYTIFIIKKQ